MATVPGIDAHPTDADGNSITFEDGQPIPAGTDAVLLSGRDGSTAKHLKANTDGELVVAVDEIPLPPDAATETTLASFLAAFNAEDFASETTLATLAAAFLAEDFASETTLAAFFAAFSSTDFATQTTLAALLTAFNGEDFASETTLASFRADFNAEDFATQTTLAALLAAFSAEDFASETTLAAFQSDFNAEDFASETTLAALLAAFGAEDFASEATLASVLANQTNGSQRSIVRSGGKGTSVAADITSNPINADVEALHVDGSNVTQPISAAALPLPAGAATESTLSSFRSDFNAEDFASQTTLAALLAAFNAEDFASETTLAAILAAFNAEDFASQTTLAALLAAFNAEDFASQTTLAALLAAFNAEDFASETTLATRLADATFTNRINTLGQKVMAASTPVVISSNQSPVSVTPTRPANASVTSVAASASNVTLLAANANRFGATIYNDANRAVFVKLGATASSTSFTVRMASDDLFEVPFAYTGRIDAIWASGGGLAGSARVTEVTA